MITEFITLTNKQGERLDVNPAHITHMRKMTVGTRLFLVNHSWEIRHPQPIEALPLRAEQGSLYVKESIDQVRQLLKDSHP